MTRILPRLAAVLALSVSTVTGVGLAHAAEDTRIGNWAATCDAPMCRASLPSASGRQALLLGRFETGDGIALGLATPGAIADRDRPMTLRVDGRKIVDLEPKSSYAAFERVEAFWITDAKVAEAVLSALRAGKQFRVEYIDVTGAPNDADFDVADLAKILAWTDGRLGRVTAKPTGAAPRGLAAAPETTRADLVIRQGLPPRLVAKHMAASACEAPDSPLLRTFKPVIAPLSTTAILYAVPCTASVGNISYRLWVVESGEIGGITPLYFASFDPHLGWKGSDLLYNVSFDAAEKRLVSVQRTGAGCGSRGVWKWKEWTFAMEETRLAADCVEGRDATAWPRVWPAEK